MHRILLLGHGADIHVAAVDWALRGNGHVPLRWDMDGFPARQAASLELDGPDGSVVVEGLEKLFGTDTVWRRRAVRPTTHPGLHASDQPVAERESRFFLDNAIRVLAPEARWVNPVEGRNRAACKALQLQAARAVGLAVPPTLMSNDPATIAGFVARHGEVVVKPFFPAAWKAGEAQRMFYATRLDREMLTREFALRAAPAIYQPVVPRAYELRVTVMGASCFAACIDPPAGAEGVIDWREDLHARNVTPYDLPDALRDGCLAMMRRLGIVFGCIDIIRRPDGDYVFLEVNEMGAFLWVEECAPSIPLLAAFSDFLLDGTAEYRWRPRDAPGIYEFRASAAYQAFEAGNDPALLAHQYRLTQMEAA